MIIAQLSDLHVRPRGRTAYRLIESNTMVENAFRAVLALRPQPDLVLLSGDIVDAGMPEEYQFAVPLIQRYLKMPVFAVPGNHDNREHFISHMKSFTKALLSETSACYTVEDFEPRFVMLDTHVPGKHHGELGNQQLDYLDKVLSAQPNRETIVVMHHPPFSIGIDHLDHSQLVDGKKFTEIVSRHRNVANILCGHTHRSVVTRVAHAIATTAPSVAQQTELDLSENAPTAFMFEPPAFHLHLWKADCGLVTHTALVDRFPGPFAYYKEPNYYVA